MYLFSNNIFLPDRKFSGYLKIESGKIADIVEKIANNEEYIDYSDYYILPGYIDIHVHGWGCGSYWLENTPESIIQMAKDLPKCGVTSFLPTTCAASKDETRRYILSANEVYGTKISGAEMLGIHMEGPFINADFGGMMDKECCMDPDLSFMKELYEIQKDKTMIKLMTLAPELPNSKDLICYLNDHNIQCNIGHSGATFDCITSLKGYGLNGVTHMFSGMKGLHHRELGVVGSAMYYNDLICEFAKQTGLTVKHEAFDIVYRLKGSDKIYLTTDCAGIAKVKEPHYHYVRKETFIPEGDKLRVRNDDGSEYFIDPTNYDQVKDLELSFDKSIQNLIKHTFVTPFDIMKMSSINPAKHIGVYDRKGSLEIGKDADIIVTNSKYELINTYCLGESKI